MAQAQIFHNQFPDYFLTLNVSIPIRNRTAQATNQRAILQQRQSEAQLQQLKNSILLDVRNTYIALQQDHARVQAASKARELQQQTFNAEQKKYQLGASTVYNVILTQRDLVSAQASELRAMADLVEAKANYERAVGRTLEVNGVTITDAKQGQIECDTLIPGTLHGYVVGTGKPFRPDNDRRSSRMRVFYLPLTPSTLLQLFFFPGSVRQRHSGFQMDRLHAYAAELLLNSGL